MNHIRKAGEKDLSRIAEILVFSKRKHYRRVFQDDDFSFGVLQVMPIVQELREHPEKLAQYFVYDDGFVKGLIRLSGEEIAELYVDPFFERQGIGKVLIAFALTKILHPRLWVLEGNEGAVCFYQRMGFVFTGERQFVPGTDKYELRMVHRGPYAEGRMLGRYVHVTIDRPFGSAHPAYPDTIYPVNYGYIEGVMGGDGEPQDAYVLGIYEPLEEISGRVTAIIHREDDTEEKWVVVPDGIRVYSGEILNKTAFQEKYFRSWMELN